MFRPTRMLMGGGGRYPFPKWVWSPTGGWWTNPSNWKSNTMVVATGIFLIQYMAVSWASDNERRWMYPQKWIPSMLWEKEFHDPEHVAFWKKQLKEEGRDWIDPKTGKKEQL